MDILSKNSLYFRALTFLILFLLAGTASAEIGESTRDRVQSVFIFKFLKFITWPEQSALLKGSELSIAVIGDTPMAPLLKNFEGQPVHNRKIVIEDQPDLKLLDQYDVLIFAESARGTWNHWKSRLKSRPILTIADWDGFAESGGHINFFLLSDKVRFKINYKASKTSGLAISSRVLQLADIVNTTIP